MYFLSSYCFYSNYFCLIINVNYIIYVYNFCFVDLGSGGESVKKLETKIFVGNTATNTAKTELVTVSIDCIYCNWFLARLFFKSKWNEHSVDLSGYKYYCQHQMFDHCIDIEALNLNWFYSGKFNWYIVYR